MTWVQTTFQHTPLRGFATACARFAQCVLRCSAARIISCFLGRFTSLVAFPLAIGIQFLL